MATLEVWVEAEAVRSDWEWDKGKIRYAKVGRLLRHRPTTKRPDCHLIKVEIEVPLSVFEHEVKVVI